MKHQIYSVQSTQVNLHQQLRRLFTWDSLILFPSPLIGKPHVSVRFHRLPLSGPFSVLPRLLSASFVRCRSGCHSLIRKVCVCSGNSLGDSLISVSVASGLANLQLIFVFSPLWPAGLFSDSAWTLVQPTRNCALPTCQTSRIRP